MKSGHPFKQLSALILIAVCFSLAATVAQADAVNKKQVLRKAGGPSSGTLTQVLVTIYPHGGGDPYTYQSYDRIGEAKIPKKKGNTSTYVADEGTDLDSTVTGKIRKPKIKRGGKLIKYKGTGNMDLIYEGEQPFAGNAKATSKVKGKKVKTTGKLSGGRIIEANDYQVVTCVANGAGKY